MYVIIEVALAGAFNEEIPGLSSELLSQIDMAPLHCGENKNAGRCCMTGMSEFCRHSG